MSQKLFIILTLQLISFSEAALESQEIVCDAIRHTEWIAAGDNNTCVVDVKGIDAPGFMISSQDDSVSGLWFDSNKNIYFLPVEIHQSFQFLAALTASNCSIQAVSKKNFRNLDGLKFVFLNDNQITRIPSDLFDDNRALEEVYLGEFEEHEQKSVD